MVGKNLGKRYRVQRHLYRGQWFSIGELAELARVDYYAMAARIRKTKDIEECVHGAWKATGRPPRTVEIEGVVVRADEAAEMVGVTRSQMIRRLKMGLPWFKGAGR